MRPFWCPVTILNTIDHLSKFDGKADERFFIGYSLNRKAFRVFNSRTRIVEETLHIRFSENTPKNAGSGPNWLFDIDTLTKTMNYQPVVVGTQSNDNAVNVVGRKSSSKLHDDLNMYDLEDFSIFEDSNEDVFGAEADLNNLESTFQVYKDKLDERGIVIRNKARLVAQGHTQEEGIDYDEVFAPVAGIEAIRLFLAYVSFKDFMVYQMDVKSAFLYGNIEEEVYVWEPLRFEDPNFPDKVYKVEKALYGLHQALRAWTFWTTAKSKTINGEVKIHALVDGMKVIITESSLRRDLQLTDEDDKTQTKATSNEPSSQGTSLGDGPRRQDIMGDTSAHTRILSYIGITSLPISCCLQALTNLHNPFVVSWIIYSPVSSTSPTSAQQIGDLDFRPYSALNGAALILAWDEMCGFGKAIDNDPDGVMSV
nr:retrovirus-related Pol polyprotein from transposon TNT 1-94 [Tanacetum cinerariifolium]